MPLPDGRVLVFDADAKKIVIADLASGKVETRMSEGTEDNEFVAPGPLWSWPGDSTASYDGGKARMMIFGPDGTLARTVRLGPPVQPVAPDPVVGRRAKRPGSRPGVRSPWTAPAQCAHADRH